MEIKKIEVKNFHGKDYDFAPGKVNPIISMNGSGKTSLLRAILWGLTGEKAEADNTEVRITLADDFVIERSRYAGKNACKLNDVKVTDKALAQAIEDRIGISLEKVKLAASEEVLEAKKPEDLLSAMISFVSEKLTVDKVIAHLTSPSEAIITKVKEVFQKTPKEFTLEAIDKAYTELYAERKAKSNTYREKDALLKSLKETATEPAREVEQIEKELIDLQVTERSAEDSSKKLKEWEQAKAREEKRLADMKRIEEELKNIKYKSYTTAQCEMQEASRASADQRRLQLTEQETTVKNNIQTFENTLKNLDKPVCPISGKLVCTTDKTAVKAELEKSVADNKKLLEDIARQKNLCQETIEAYAEWRKGYEESKEAYLKRSELLGQFKAYKENPIEVPAKPAEVDLAKISEKKAALSSEKKNAENWAQIKVLDADLASLKADLLVVDALVTAFKDKGEVKEAIIRDYLSIFEDAMNARADMFCPGYSVSLSINGGLRTALKTPYNEDSYAPGTLSGGERLLLRFLMMDMLNQLTGTRLLMLDNVEVLDAEALENLVRIMNSEEFQEEYDHVFIAGVNHPDILNIFGI